MWKKVVAAALAAAVGCACGESEGAVSERWTCFGGDFVVTHYADGSGSATCQASLLGAVRETRLDVARACSVSVRDGSSDLVVTYGFSPTHGAPATMAYRVAVDGVQSTTTYDTCQFYSATMTTNVAGSMAPLWR